MAIIKHTNPSGLASAKTLLEAYRLAFVCDPVSAYGSIIATNREVDLPLVQEIGSLFVEVLAAPGYSADALDWLAATKRTAGDAGALRRGRCSGDALGGGRPAGANAGYARRG